MADTATTNSAPVDGDKAHKARPEKPDEEKFKADVSKAEKELSAAQERLNAVKAKLDLTKPNNKESPVAKKQQELRAELSSIRQQQSGFKTSRGSTQEKLASLDTQLKSRIAEQKTARSKVAFKSVDEVDNEIQRLEKQVDSGKMTLVDEKKALAEVSSLRKQRKGFAGFEEAQKGIDDVKSQISELRKSMDNPEAKALSERYNSIAKELDEIKAEQDSAYKGLNALRDERTKLHGERETKYAALKEIKDHYYKSKSAYRDYDQMLWKQRQEKQKAERDAYAKEKRKKIAEQKLEEASSPAYMDEILTAEGLIRYFDPSSAPEVKSLKGPSGFAAEAQRTVDTSGIKGTALSKKEDRDDTYFMGTGGKKGKKGKKGTASPAPSTPVEGKFNVNMGVFEELAKVNVEPPSNQSDVPAVVEKLKGKVTQWKADQDKKTKENIAKAQAEIDRLEAEAQEDDASGPSTKRTQDSAKKPALANSGAKGAPAAAAEKTQEEDGVADATEELKAAKIEDIET